MIGGEQQKVLVNIGDDGILRLDENFSELLGLNEREFNWKLVREHDGKTKQSNAIGWIEWDETARFKAKHDELEVGRSLIMSPFNEYFTWQTSVVTEIVEQRPDYIKFKTQNSNYELFKL
ncbi:hypothetical protein UFOVP1307_109 [uncultured Caudovirales phage]|uniref:Uncharacterized protein n=1 Tax=uncultured Caudovirales phage TaxID=2100421 RepID=A0A6J5RYC2_9CAUD|nr:hypothetical protein UFOVP651_14 [uncultured Caudovirales phage]CAB4170719.1 hypothetical protein UFOVP902_93 [uncultured Caudovirales phage]CAB4198478.1 hypothetical protein UFOVP1307_109 [uncultured Caudovirales phage]